MPSSVPSDASKSVFKDKWVHDLQAQISGFLQENAEWVGVPEQSRPGQKKLMDYACGNGIVTRV